MLTMIAAFFAVGSAIPLILWLTYDLVLPAVPLGFGVVILAGLIGFGRRRLRVWTAILSCLAGYSLVCSAIADTAQDYAWCEAVSAGVQGDAVFHARVQDLSGLFATNPSIVVAVTDLRSNSVREVGQRNPRLLVYLDEIPSEYVSPGTGLLLEGDIIEIRGRIDPVKGPKFFGGVSPRAIYLPRRIVGVVSGGAIQAIHSAPEGRLQLWFGLRRAVSAVRLLIASTVKYVLPEAEAGIVMSGFLGMTGALPDHVDDAMRSAGLSHLLSVSGMHVGMVAAGTVLLLRGFTSDPKKARALCVPFVCLYAVLAGARVSVIRALLMFGLASLSATGALGWSPRRITEFVALVLMVIDPMQLAQVSFQLSFGATYGIVVLSSFRPRERLHEQKVTSFAVRVRTWLGDVAVVSLGAQIGVVPALALHFRSVPLIGGPATVLATPLFVLGITSALTGVAVHAIGLEVASAPLIELGRHLLSMLISGAVALGGMRYSSVDLSCVWSRALACAAASVWAPLLSARRDNLTRAPRINRWAALAVGVITLIAVLFASVSQMVAESRFDLYVLSVGQGDCIVCVAPGGRALVVDAGPAFRGDGYSYDSGESVLLPFLKWRGIKHIDVFILTHFHSDHFGGLQALINRNMVSVICSPDPSLLQNLLKQETVRYTGVTLDQLHTSHRRPPLLVAMQAGDVIGVGEVSIEALWPLDQGEGEVDLDENARSVVLLVTYYRFNALLTGDIGADQEIEVINRLRGGERSVRTLEAEHGTLMSSGLEVLKVAHHGSRNSSSYVFLRSLSPWLSVVSTGTNRYGHPSPDAISRLESHSEVVIRTDEDGSVRVWSDGSHLGAVTSRGQRLAQWMPLR